MIEPDYKDADIRRLSIGVTDQNSGYNISEFECKGTNSEVIGYLKKDRLAENWYTTDRSGAGAKHGEPRGVITVFDTFDPSII